MISELKEDLQNLLHNVQIGIHNSKTTSELENIRVNSLGKKGSITMYLKNLRDYDLETKKEIGAYLNDIKSQINKLILDNQNITNENKEVVSLEKKNEIEFEDEVNNARKKRRRSSASIE